MIRFSVSWVSISDDINSWPTDFGAGFFEGYGALRDKALGIFWNNVPW